MTGFLFAIGIFLAILLLNNLWIMWLVTAGLIWLIYRIWWIIPIVILLWIFLAFLISV